jgi:hypothetical protein
MRFKNRKTAVASIIHLECIRAAEYVYVSASAAQKEQAVMAVRVGNLWHEITLSSQVAIKLCRAPPLGQINHAGCILYIRYCSVALSSFFERESRARVGCVRTCRETATNGPPIALTPRKTSL